MSISVPVISLKSIDDPACQGALARQVAEAARNSGFFQVVDHGIPEDLIAQAFGIARKTFALSLDEKKKLARNPKTNRGYDMLGGQTLDGAVTAGQHEGHGKVLANERTEESTEAVQDPDLKEGWMVGPPGFTEEDEYWGRFGHGKNVFPSEEQVPGMEKVLGEYYVRILDLATRIMRIVALSLDLPIDTFESLCRKPAAALRLLHYPPEVDGTGAGAHTDFGLVTLLATDGAPGLELWSGTEWVPLEPTSGAYICNVGDILALYTGGEYKSSLHRVMNKSGVERYSLPFFLDGNSDILVKPTRGPNVDKLQGVTVEEHLRNRFDGTYSSANAGAAMAVV